MNNDTTNNRETQGNKKHFCTKDNVLHSEAGQLRIHTSLARWTTYVTSIYLDLTYSMLIDAQRKRKPMH